VVPDGTIPRGTVTTYIALLRGINVGGRKPVAMGDLRDLLTRAGLAEVQSLLQSGNLVFRSASHTAAQLEALLESRVAAQLALDTRFFVRSAAEWAAIVRRNPFPDEADRDPGHLVVMLFKQKPRAGDVKTLQAGIRGREVIRAGGPHAYIVFPDGQGRSKLTNALIERTLGTPGTARNWNTVLKLEALVRPA